MDMTADNSDTLSGQPCFFDIIKLQCNIWPHGESPPDFHQGVVSELPVLLMSGERDPVTPPQYAAQVAGNLPQQPQPGPPVARRTLS